MRTTYFVEMNYGFPGGRCFDETPIGFSENDVIDKICGGHYGDNIRNIYRCGLGEVTEEVTDDIAKKIIEIGKKSDLPRDVLAWLDWAGYGFEEAAE